MKSGRVSRHSGRSRPTFSHLKKKNMSHGVLNLEKLRDEGLDDDAIERSRTV